MWVAPHWVRRTYRSLRDAIDHAQIGLFFALDTLCFCFRAPTADLAIVMRLDAIGDFFIWLQSGAVQTTDFCRGEAGHTVLLANQLWADYARGTGLWDEVIGIDTDKFCADPFYRIKTALQVRGLGAKLLIVPTNSRVFEKDDSLVRVAGAARKIGSAGVRHATPALFRALGRANYSRLIPIDGALKAHETLRNAEFTVLLTGHPPTPFNLRTLHVVEPAAQMAVAMGAGWSGRVWPIEKLAALIGEILKEHPGMQVVLLGSAGDRSDADRLAKLIGRPVDDQVGRTSLHQFVETIGRSRLVICNESAAYHIAMSLGTKSICMLGGGHFGRFAPYPASASRDAITRTLSLEMDCFGCNWVCKFPKERRGPVRCIDDIPVELAERSAAALLR
jgi:hypothetical protein